MIQNRPSETEFRFRRPVCLFQLKRLLSCVFVFCLFRSFVGFDDFLYKRMADNVFTGEGVEIQSFDVAQFFAGIFEAGFDVARQVDLADVAGDDGFGAEADAGQEHFHLFGRGVLGFVENDVCAVERAAAHIGERGDFDETFFHEFGDAVETHEVVKGIVERTQIGIDFLGEVAGQEAEFFACFDGWADEDDALDLVFFHGIDGGGDSEVGFTCACGAESEDDVVIQKGADVAVLARGASAYAAAFGAEIVLLVVLFFLVGVVGGFGFDGGKADGVVVKLALFGGLCQRE